MNNTLFPSSPRVYLWVALGLLAFVNFQTWMKDYGPPPQSPEVPPVAGAPAAPATDLRNQLPAGAQSASGDQHRGAGYAGAAAGAAAAAGEGAGEAPRRSTCTPTCSTWTSACAGARSRASTCPPIRR